MFKWIMSLFRKNKVYTDEEQSIIINPPVNNNYEDIVSKLCDAKSCFTQNDITFLNKLSSEQLVYLILILKQ